MPITSTMRLLGHLRHRLSLLTRSEQGMALPTAIFAMVASLGFASVAVVSSVDTQRGTARDNDSKSAIAAADAGASVALLRLNRYSSALNTSTPCLGLSGSTLVATRADVDGWCPAIAGTVGGSTYSYRVTPQVIGSPMTVVATGTDGVVSRRIAISFRATTVGSALANEGLIGQDRIEIDNNADARVGIGTNGDVYVHNNGNVCGNVRYGVGRRETFENNATQCRGYVKYPGNVTLPSVSTFIPTDIATNNHNYRLVKCVSAGNPVGCELDSYTKRRTSTVPWNPMTRVISTSNNASLTLTGGDYFICSLTLNNNVNLIISESAQVRIFFDTPENCGLRSGAKQIDVQNNAYVKASGYEVGAGKFNLPGFYLLGSPTIQTYASWSNNAEDAEMVLYGPNTDVQLFNNMVFTGAIAGKTVHLNNNAVVEAAAAAALPQIGGATLYQRQSYIECTGATASPPDANC